VIPRKAKSRADVLAILMDRREELDIPLSNVDEIVGLPDRYASKTITFKAKKGLSLATLQAVMDALALGIAEITIFENAEQAARMATRWQRRLRPPTNGLRVECVPKDVKGYQSSFNFTEMDA
jgi:hypothetical protein